MSATGAASIWDKINEWMAPLAGAIDALMRPLVQPLADQFDSITGDSEEVRSTAQRWRDLATKVRALETFEREVVAQVAQDWQGQASDAFQGAIRELLTQVEDLSTQMDETAEFLDDAAQEVQLAEELIETIIRELIEWALLTLAVSAALSLVTLGASAAAGAATAAAEAAVAGSRIATIVGKVAQALTRLAELLRAVKAMKTFSREGFLIKTLLVKGLILKPAVRGVTGLTGSPVGGGLSSIESNLRDIVLDEYDDQVDGDTAEQTPIRDEIDDAVGPAADASRGPAQAVDDVVDAADDHVPSPPWK